MPSPSRLAQSGGSIEEEAEEVVARVINTVVMIRKRTITAANITVEVELLKLSKEEEKLRG